MMRDDIKTTYKIHTLDVKYPWDLSKRQAAAATEIDIIDVWGDEQAIDAGEVAVGECEHEWALVIVKQGKRVVWRSDQA